MGRILYLGTDPSNFQHQELIHYPVIKTVPLKIPEHVLEDIDDYTHVIVTSKNTVLILDEILQTLKNKHIIAIGQSTAAELLNLNCPPSKIAENETQEGIIEILQTENLEGAYVFYPRSALARPLIEFFLQKRGIRHQICDVYETVFQKPEPHPNFEEIDEIVFTSPSTVKGFIEAFGSIPKDKKLTSIGPITEKYLKQEML